MKLTRGQSVNERFEVIEELAEWDDRARYRVKDLKTGLTALLEHRSQAVRTVEPSRSFWPSPLDCATLIQIESHLLRRLYGYGYLDARPYLILEELEGPSLEDWLKDAKPDPEYWMPVVLAALSGLATLHDQGLVHGQWQPSSLTLTKRGAVIHDFGAFVSEFESFDRPSELSSPYSAPELGSIQPIDRRADLYAIGVLLVRLLTGRLPFEGSAEQVQRLQLRGLGGRQIELPDQQRFAPLIESLLHRQPSERPRDARTVAMQLHELTGLAAELPERAPQSVLVPEFVGRRRELAVVNAAASFMIDGAEIEGVDEASIDGSSDVHRRSTRLVRMRHESDRMPLAPTSWVQIYGPPGLGKRRFVAEFSYRLMAHGIDLICLSGQSLRGETFDPITLILERLLSRHGARARLEEASESVCRALLRFMPDRYSEIPTPASQVEDEEDLLSPEEGLGLRSRLLDGLTSFIVREAQARPITLIITDFELLPDLARELIAHLTRRVATSRRWQGRLSARSRSNPSDGTIPLFVVTTSELLDTTRSAASDGIYTLEISKLKDGDIERMLASAAGASSIDAPLLSAILDSAQGSPRRTIELLHRLQAAGPLQIRGGSLCAPDSALVPELLDGAALLASIRHESPLVLEILFVFARLQRPVPSPLLFDLFDAREVLEALHGMIKAQVIRRGPQGLLLLRDARLGALAVEELDSSIAAGLDKRIQESLELAYLQLRSDDRLVELAEHALLAGLPERSIDYVVEAAGRFERIRADDRAARLYEGVISKRPELELRVRLAGSYFRCERTSEAIKELREVAQSAGDSWPLVPRVIVQRRLAFMLRAAERLDEALEAFVAGERLLEESPADFESAREHAALLCEKSEMLLGAGTRLETVARIAERAQAVLREHAGAAHGRDVSLVRARLLGLQGQLELLRDRLDGAEHLMRGALAMQERHGAVLEAARSLYRLGNLELSRGRDDRAEKLWERSLKLREESGDREGAALILSNLSLAAARLGQLEKARELTFKSLRIREEAGDLYGRASSLHNLGFIYQAGGKLEEAVSAYNECLALRETLDDPLYAARAQTNLGHTLFLLGETIEARDRLSAGLATARELNDPEGEAAALVRLAEIDFFRGRFERAQRRIAQSRDLRQSFGGPEESVDTAQVEAVIDMGLGRVSAALERMEKAITLARSHRLQLQLARALLSLGRMLIQVRDFDRAKGCLVEAQQLYLQFGDLRSLRITLMELATVYVAVGLHSDAYAVSGPQLQALEPSENGRGEPLGRGIDRVREVLILSLLELVSREGDQKLARKLALEAAELCQSARLTTQLWRALRLASAASEALGDTDEALAFAAEAQEIVEELAAGLPEDQRAVYLSQPQTQSAIHGDPALDSIRARYQPQTEVPPRNELGGRSKTLGVTIVPAQAPKTPAPTISKAHPRTLHIKKLRSRSRSTTDVLKSEGRFDNAAWQSLTRLATRIVERQDVDATLSYALEQIAQLCHGERAFIAWRGKDGDLEVLSAVKFTREQVRETQNAFTLELAQGVMDRGTLVVSDDAAQDPQLLGQSSVLGLGVRSVLVVPIRVRSGRAALYVDHRFQRNVFHAERQSVAQSFADQLALLLDLRSGPGESDSGVRKDSEDLRFETKNVFRLEPFSGCSSFMESLYNRSPELAAGREPLHICGEFGTGKRTLAETLHALSPQRHGPFVFMDAATIPEEGAEAELLGQLAGAYEGAIARPGLLRSARGGSLVLENLLRASERVVAILLGVLRQGTLRPVGADEAEPLQTRIIVLSGSLLERGRSESHQALELWLARQRLELVPLRARPEDIPFAAHDRLAEIAAQTDTPIKSLSPEAQDALVGHSWPGNYTELSVVLERAARAAGGRGVIGLSDLPNLDPDTSGNLDSLYMDLETAVRVCQRQAIQRALESTGDRDEAAAQLGLPRRKLNKLMKKLGL